MLKIPEFESKTWWVNVAFKVDSCYRDQGVTKLYCFKESKFHEIFLICGHMAQNPYFPADRKMCLMGDIQVSSKFSMSNDVHLLRRGIRILSYALFEMLLFQWLKILPFKTLVYWWYTSSPYVYNMGTWLQRTIFSFEFNMKPLSFRFQSVTHFSRVWWVFPLAFIRFRLH